MWYVRSPLLLFADSIFNPPLLTTRRLTKPRTVCFSQPVVMPPRSLRGSSPFARFIIAMTSAFLLLRQLLLQPFRPRSRRLALAGGFFAFLLAGATVSAWGASSGDKRRTGVPGYEL